MLGAAAFTKFARRQARRKIKKAAHFGDGRDGVGRSTRAWRFIESGSQTCRLRRHSRHSVGDLAGIGVETNSARGAR
jgi:hypothetical protein